MIFGVLLDFIIGILMIIFGILIWKKQKISLLHSYHYKNVKKENISAYCKNMGIANVLIGLSIIFMGIFTYFEYETIAYIFFTLGFIVSIYIIQKHK